MSREAGSFEAGGFQAGSFKVGQAIGPLGGARLHQGVRDPDGRAVWVAVFGQEPTGFWERIPALARIRHDHLVPLVDFGSAEGRPYMAFEPPVGTPLGQTLARGPIDGEVAAQLGAALCKALHALHAADLRGWDLDPDHLYLGRADADGVELRFLTLGGSGDARYQPPEDRAGQARSVAGDLHVVGVILYQLVAGSHPHDQASQGGAPRRLRVLVPEVSKGLDAVVMRCLSPRADERYQSAAELMDALLKPPPRKSVSWNVKTLDPGPSLGAAETPRWTQPTPAVLDRPDRLGLAGRILVAVLGALVAAALVLWVFRRS